MKPLVAFVLGVGLATVNPKNLAFLVAGGLALAQVTSAGQQAAGLIVFTLVAASSVWCPLPRIWWRRIGSRARSAISRVG
jgi:hypothetical protein